MKRDKLDAKIAFNTHGLNVQTVYQTNGKESIYKRIDDDFSIIASGGPSSYKVLKKAE